MLTIAFWCRQFSERGTEVATYDYALYNETILGNRSIIMCNEGGDNGWSYQKFADRFPIIKVKSIKEMPKYIREYNINFFYSLTGGGIDETYEFRNRDVWISPCKTIKHCVFDTNGKESDFYICIGNSISNNKHLVIPHIVNLPQTNENLRQELNIPNDAIVFGRHGGHVEFNLGYVKEAIKQILNENDNMYFVFLNTERFYEHPHIIHLNINTDLLYKSRFINTCDAMIHARGIGESFGLSVAEFSFFNKPVFTANCGWKEHINILGDKAIIYNSYDEILDKFRNARNIINSRNDWNAYENYSPEKVMNMFNNEIFSKA